MRYLPRVCACKVRDDVGADRTALSDERSALPYIVVAAPDPSVPFCEESDWDFGHVILDPWVAREARHNVLTGICGLA